MLKYKVMQLKIHAHIFAGGLGTRLRPLTNDTPKPLVKIHDIPLVKYGISFLNKVFSPELITINTHHLANQFLEQKFPANVNCYEEKDLQGQGISMLFWENFHKNADIIVAINGDSIFEDSKHTLKTILNHFDQIPTEEKIAIITQQSEVNPLLVSDIHTLKGIKKKDGTNFYYMPKDTNFSTYSDASGIYFFTPNIIQLVRNLNKTEKFIGFYGENDLMQYAIQNGWHIQCYEIPMTNKYEVTSLDDYHELNSHPLELNYAIND